jgi:hypothetical protein
MPPKHKGRGAPKEGWLERRSAHHHPSPPEPRRGHQEAPGHHAQELHVRVRPAAGGCRPSPPPHGQSGVNCLLVRHDTRPLGKGGKLHGSEGGSRESPRRSQTPSDAKENGKHETQRSGTFRKPARQHPPRQQRLRRHPGVAQRPQLVGAPVDGATPAGARRLPGRLRSAARSGPEIHEGGPVEAGQRAPEGQGAPDGPGGAGALDALAYFVRSVSPKGHACKALTHAGDSSEPSTSLSG